MEEYPPRANGVAGSGYRGIYGRLSGKEGGKMSVSGINNSAMAGYATEAARSAGSSGAAKSEKSEETKKTYTGGRTVGKPQLSEKAAKYYEQLKEKYGDMEFVLVSKDRMEEVKKNAAAYGSANKTVVLIDDEKIERMANDEEYRKKYEGLIEKGRQQMKSMAEKLGPNESVKGFGMQVNDDGTLSYFAAMEKSSKAMNEKLAEKRAEKKAEAKAADKKAQKERALERLQEKRSEKPNFDPDSVETVSADSVEALLDKISELDFSKRADSILTESEKQVGSSIDYKG